MRKYEVLRPSMDRTRVKVLFAVSTFVAGVTGVGDTVLSRLEGPTIGHVSFGSDSAIAVLFRPGDQAPGYRLDKVTVLLDPWEGERPALSAAILRGFFPNEADVTPMGPGSWGRDGQVTFEGNGMLLWPGGWYWLKLELQPTPSTEGVGWGMTQLSATRRSGGWMDRFVWRSDGGNWQPAAIEGLQYALDVTPVPEPSSLALLALGSWWFWLGKRQWRGKGG